MTKIDQIMVRNVGGWNLVSEHEWELISPKKRLQLVTEKSVQFFDNGVEVDTMDALKALASVENASPADASVTSQRSADGKLEKSDGAIELAASRLSTATYARLVIAGPLWQVQRSTLDEPGVPFSKVRKRESDNVYDLDDPNGSKLLISDLIADAYGISDPLEAILPAEALDYFDTTYFSTDLGDRFWEVPAIDIRYKVESNPHIMMLSPTDT